jgi:hypothetical protein
MEIEIKYVVPDPAAIFKNAAESDFQAVLGQAVEPCCTFTVLSNPPQKKPDIPCSVPPELLARRDCEDMTAAR